MSYLIAIWVVLRTLLPAWLLDRLCGDPVSLPHPVIWFGRMIGFWEKRLNKGRKRIFKGGVMAVALILFAYLATWGIEYLLSYIGSSFIGSAFFANPYIGNPLVIVFDIICIFFCLAGTTLIREVKMVFEAVDRSLEEGRTQVGRIVGRDTSELSAQEVRTAALETLAENLSDGVIAPLFWYLLLGVPGMMAYKMINTLDSMIGYHNDRYLLFGRVAARIDDVANYIPARLTAFLMVLANGKLSLLSFVKKYGKEHASPNSGYPEAALAGILNCRFGGPHYYFGQLFPKPYIGVNGRLLTTTDMLTGITVNRRSEVMMIVLVILLRACFLNFLSA